jgi:hypothetical protein
VQTALRRARLGGLAVVLGLLLGALIGREVALGQAGPPATPQTIYVGHGYVFLLENFQILHTRARHNDTDHVSMALRVGDKTYTAPVRHVGDVNDGLHKIGLSIGPVPVPDPQTPVVLAYLILNSGHREDLVAESLRGGADFLAKEQRIAAGLSSIATSLASSATNIVFANCDGWVAGDHIPVTGRTLADWGRGHRETRDYPGLNSPTGCGDNSRYRVTWSVARK